MSSELISELYEAIDEQGTGFLGVDPSNDKCLVAFEIQANYCSDDFNLYIEIPSTVQSFAMWEGEAAFLTYDGSVLNTALVSYADISTYESAPNEYTVIIQIEVIGDVLNDLVASTAFIAVCSYAMPVARGQQGTVTTYPTEYLSVFEITTSLDGQPTKLAPPRPTYHIKRCEQLSDGLVGRRRKRKRVQGRISSFRKLELDGGLTESVSWKGGV